MDENRPVHQTELSAKEPNKEDEFFRKQENEKLEEHARARKEREREELKKLHYMHCPKCGQTLQEQQHESVLVDCCPDCQGIWFDAGELEKVNQKEQGFLTRWFGL